MRPDITIAVWNRYDPILGKDRNIKMQKRIYLADDEENIRVIMKTFLENAGYAVECFEDGTELIKTFEKAPADLVILDIMMPGEDGLSICSYLRRKSRVPIIIVSSRDSAYDKVIGITQGSDDYIAKPFLPLELVARVQAVLKRTEIFSHVDTGNLFCGNMTIRKAMRKILVDGMTFPATPTEYEFLLYLMERLGHAVSKKEILREVWHYQDAQDIHVVDDLVKRLRKKLRQFHSTAFLETIWGFGYQLSEQTAAADDLKEGEKCDEE